MRRISGTDSIFDILVKGPDEIIYNLFYLIREDLDSYLVTNDRTYILAQSNAKTPVWIFQNGIPEPEVKEELCEIILEKFHGNNHLKINAKETYITDVLDQVSKQTGKPYTVNMPMNVYACRNVNRLKPHGSLITPGNQHKDRMAELLKEMVYDAEKVSLSDESAYEFANKMVNSDRLFLWENNEVVSMAMIAHRSEKYARINTVVTDKANRGRGYAGMLVSELSSRILSSSRIPMLYADARNPAANKAYQKIGFEKQGEITEFIFG